MSGLISSFLMGNNKKRVRIALNKAKKVPRDAAFKMARLEYAAALRENAKLNFALIKSTKKVAAARQRRLYEYDRLKKGESNEKPLEEGVDYPGSPAVVWSTRWTALPKKKSQSTTRESLFGSSLSLRRKTSCRAPHGHPARH